MRGKLPGWKPSNDSSRNIPAYAGKTIWCTEIRTLRTEHPRVCGENLMLMPSLFLVIGTSPRMRGKLIVFLVDRPRDRNIPAYAGKTSTANRVVILDKEHPRVCGENSLGQCAVDDGGGTSPRMRGKLVRINQPSRNSGNIPAYAGKTCLGVDGQHPIAEHPRVCGENQSQRR